MSTHGIKWIQIDTREHSYERKRIEGQFDRLGQLHFSSKLYVGDYCFFTAPQYVVDRKQNLLELCQNVCQEHERFKAELVRALEHGIHITIVCEHGEGIKTLEDVYWWQNPRRAESPKATNGEQLYKSLCTIKERYGVDFIFCEPSETGQVIIEELMRWQNKDM